MIWQLLLVTCTAIAALPINNEHLVRMYGNMQLQTAHEYDNVTLICPVPIEFDFFNFIQVFKCNSKQQIVGCDNVDASIERYVDDNTVFYDITLTNVTKKDNAIYHCKMPYINKPFYAWELSVA